MIGNLLVATISVFAAVVLWPATGIAHVIAVGFCILALWQFYCAVTASRHPASPVVLRLGGFAWTKEDFCRGWLITGQIGTGKTLGAINAMLWQVSKNCPSWGGVCVDDKGLYWETLSVMLRELGREKDLILLQVRPADAPADWKPAHTFNILDNPYLPYSAKAKLVCDVAASLGQRADQSFFRMQAQVQMEFAFQALSLAGYSVTLRSAYGMLTSDSSMAVVMDAIAKLKTPEADLLTEHYNTAFVSQPAEQLGGVKTTIANYLKYFTDPDIADVFCSEKSSFSMDDLDRGKIICVSIPPPHL